MGTHFGEALGLFLVFIGIFFIIAYAIGCYINYRIVAKFEPEIGFGQNLIPFWNYYLLIRAAVSRPVLYFWASILIAIIVAVTRIGSQSHFVYFLGTIINIGIFANILGLIAEKLGKSFWLYFVLGFIPLVNLIAECVLAFDDSRPVAVATEPDSDQQLI